MLHGSNVTDITHYLLPRGHGTSLFMSKNISQKLGGTEREVIANDYTMDCFCLIQLSRLEYLQREHRDTYHSRAEDDLEIRLALVADGIRRTALLDLIRTPPALAPRTIQGEASLRRTSLVPTNGVGANTNITV